MITIEQMSQIMTVLMVAGLILEAVSDQSKE